MDDNMNNLISMFTLLMLLNPKLIQEEEEKQRTIKEIEDHFWSMGYRWDSHNEPSQKMMQIIEDIKKYYDNMDKTELNKNNCNCKSVDFCNIDELKNIIKY